MALFLLEIAGAVGTTIIMFLLIAGIYGFAMRNFNFKTAAVGFSIATLANLIIRLVQADVTTSHPVISNALACLFGITIADYLKRKRDISCVSRRDSGKEPL